ncbi:MAG: hypothetical protein NC228_03195, partial [[Eubacterium] siraeum]|nr:hypothetical protein [[Eubacterium] siraeum]
MKKVLNKVISIITSAVISASVIFGVPLSEFNGLAAGVEAANKISESEVRERIKLLAEYFSQGSYFTTNGKACTTYIKKGSNYSYCYSTSCPTCDIQKVVNNSSVVASMVKNGDFDRSWNTQSNMCSCMAFANFVFAFVFKANSKATRRTIATTSEKSKVYSKEFYSQAKYGDLIQFDGSLSHTAIFLGYDNNGLILYECNYAAPCKVEYNNKKRTWTYIRDNKVSTGYWTKATIYRSSYYDDGDSGTSTEQPTPTGDHYIINKNSSDSTK